MTSDDSLRSVIASAWSDLPVDHPMPGIERRRVIGQHMMVSHIRLAAGTIVASHQHANEQIVLVLSGRLRFGIGEDGAPDRRSVVVAAGEVLLLPANTPHAAEALEESLVLDAFSPPSEHTGIDR